LFADSVVGVFVPEASEPVWCNSEPDVREAVLVNTTEEIAPDRQIASGGRIFDGLRPVARRRSPSTTPGRGLISDPVRLAIGRRRRSVW